MVQQALEAAEQLAAEGISVEVIDPRTLAPLDMDTILASVHKTGRLLIVDEDFAPCGVGGGDRHPGHGARLRRPGCAGRRLERRLRPGALQPAALRAGGADAQASSRPCATCWRSEAGAAWPFEVVMPRLGWNMETGSLGEWLKQDGDHVEAGEILFTVEGDKAIQEVEALDSGILRIPADSPPPGVEVAVGTLLAYLLAAGRGAPSSSIELEARKREPATRRLRAAAQPSHQLPARSNQLPAFQ